jgi:hypothetical protein
MHAAHAWLLNCFMNFLQQPLTLCMLLLAVVHTFV